MKTENQQILEFTYINIKNICNYLKITDFTIGGSVAMLMHGVEPDRIIHDVDILLDDLNFYRAFYYAQRHRFEFVKSSSHMNSHFAIKVGGYVFDFLSASPNIESSEYVPGIKFASINHLVNIKKQYNRKKDVEDIIKLLKKS